MLIKLIKMRKAQSTAEYAILFGVIIAAVVGMQTYVKRSLSAKMKDTSDALTSVTGDVSGEGNNLKTTWQYEPYYSSSFSKVQTTKDISERKVMTGGNATTSSENEYTAHSADYTGYAGENETSSGTTH